MQTPTLSLFTSYEECLYHCFKWKTKVTCKLEFFQRNSRKEGRMPLAVRFHSPHPLSGGFQGGSSPNPALPTCPHGRPVLPAGTPRAVRWPHAAPKVDGQAPESRPGARPGGHACGARAVLAPPRGPRDEALPLGGCWRAGREWSHPRWPTASSGPSRLPNRQDHTQR